MLAALADFRYLDEKVGAICFAEVKVGLTVPASIIALIRQYCTPPMLREVVLLGKHLKAPLALESGLADGIAPAADLDRMVAKQVARLARLSPTVLRTTKAHLHAPLLATFEAAKGSDFESLTPFLGEDFLVEGLNAVIEGRPPVFER